MEIEGLEGGAEKVCNYQRGNMDKVGSKHERGRVCAREGGMRATQDSNYRKSLVLFMRRDCGFFKDKIVTTDTQRKSDNGIFGILRFFIFNSQESLQHSHEKYFIMVICFVLPGINIYIYKKNHQ